MVANLNTSVNYCIILALENVGTEVSYRFLIFQTRVNFFKSKVNYTRIMLTLDKMRTLLLVSTL